MHFLAVSLMKYLLVLIRNHSPSVPRLVVDSWCPLLQWAGLLCPSGPPLPSQRAAWRQINQGRSDCARQGASGWSTPAQAICPSRGVTGCDEWMDERCWGQGLTTRSLMDPLSQPRIILWLICFLWAEINYRGSCLFCSSRISKAII